MLHYRSSTLVLALGCALLLSGCNPFDPITGVEWGRTTGGQRGWVPRNPGGTWSAADQAELDALQESNRRRQRELVRLENEAFGLFEATPEYQEYHRARLEMDAIFLKGASVKLEGASDKVLLDPNRVSGTTWRGTILREDLKRECPRKKDVELRITDQLSPRMTLIFTNCHGKRGVLLSKRNFSQKALMLRSEPVVITGSTVDQDVLYLTREGDRMYGTFFEVFGSRWSNYQFRTSTSTLELVLTPTEPAM